MKRNLKLVLALLPIYVYCHLCFGQSPTLEAHWWTPNGTVNSVVEDPSNNVVYIGGSFNFVGKNVRFGTLLTTTSGHADFNFLNPNGTVHAVISDGAGGWYIGGAFTTLGGVTRNRLARINSDGTLNSWNPDANGTVFTLADSGGELLVGGDFTTIGGNARSRIASVDLTTGSPTSLLTSSIDNTVSAIIVSGGIIYAGGSFTNVTGGARNRIAAWDAITGALQSWDPNANGVVKTLVADGSGVVYVGGNFTNIGGQARNRIAAISTSTGLATSFNPNAGNLVNALILDGAGTLYAGGQFSLISGISRGGLVAINTATGLPTSWNPNANGVVNTLCMNGGLVYAGGSFSTVGGQSRNCLAAIDQSTGVVSSWNPNANSAVNALFISSSGIYAGGSFTSINGSGATRNNLAAINALTGELTSWNPNANGAVNSITLVGASVVVGGDFTTVGGQSRARLAEINASTGVVSSWSPNPDASVLCLSNEAGVVYAGGSFTTVTGGARNRLAAWDIASGTLLSWDPNADNTVRTMVTDGSGLIYVGGLFLNVGGQARNRLAAVSTSTGVSNSWNPNANNTVNTIYLGGAGLVYVGGSFTNVGGSVRNRLAAIIASTGVATSWNPNASSTVQTIAIADGVLYAGGNFTTIGGQSRNRLANLDLTTGLATTWNPGSNGTINSISTGVNRIFVGGVYTSISSTAISNFSVFSNCSPVVPAVSASSSSVCSGQSTTLNLTGALNGASDWQWYEGACGGTNIGSGTSIGVSPTVTTTYFVRGEGGCAVPPGNCASLTITVADPLVPSVSISANSTSACPGESVTFTATPTNGGASPSYQWMIGGAPVSGANSATFIALAGTDIVNGDEVTCEMTSNAIGCLSIPTVTSSAVLMTIGVLLPPNTHGTYVSDLINHGDGETNEYVNNGCVQIGKIADASGGNVPGNTTMTTVVASSVQLINPDDWLYVRRSFTSTTASDGQRTLTFYFTQEDFDDYNANNYGSMDLPTSGNDSDPNKAYIRLVTVTGGSYTVSASLGANLTWNGTHWQLSKLVPSVNGSTFYFSTQSSCEGVLVSGLAAGNVSATNATLTWAAISPNPSTGYYQLRYKPTASSTWIDGGTSSYLATSKTYSALSPGTQYEYQIRRVCSSDGFGAWSASVIFSTVSSGCGSPMVFNAPTATSSTVTLSWPAVTGSGWFEFQYKATSSGTWLSAGTAAGSSTTRIVSGLNPSTSYDFRGRTYCPNGVASAWSSVLTTSTTVLSGCELPPVLLVGSVTGTTATINWTAVSGAAWYEFRYKPSSSGTWISGGTAAAGATSKTLTGLIQSTQYDFQAKTYCAGGSPSSDWSATTQFTTNSAGFMAPVDLFTVEESVESFEMKNDVETAVAVSVCPNPTDDMVQVQVLNERANETLVLRVFDMSGRLLQEVRVLTEGGVTTIPLFLGEMKAGVYNVELYNGGMLIHRARVQKN